MPFAHVGSSRPVELQEKMPAAKQIGDPLSGGRLRTRHRPRARLRLEKKGARQ